MIIFLQELLSQLSAAEKAEVNILNEQIRQLQKRHKDDCMKRMDLESEIDRVEVILKHSLIPKRDDMNEACAQQAAEFKDKQRQLMDCRIELIEIESKIKKVNRELGVLNAKIEEMLKKVGLCSFPLYLVIFIGFIKLESEHAELEKWKMVEKEVQDKTDDEARALEKFELKLNILEQRVAKSVEDIKQLEVLPAEDLYSHYVKMPSKIVSCKISSHELNNSFDSFTAAILFELTICKKY